VAGKPFFLKMGAGPLKKGAMTPLSRKKGVPAKIIIPKCTDRVFLRYRFGKNREIPTEYQPKKPNRYPTLVMKHIFAPLLLRCKEPPMHKQHCRSLIDTMKSLSPAALTLKPLRRPSNRSSPRQHFIRLCSHIVHVVYHRTWYVCRVERKTDN
jgi:hypothetical protein